MGAAVDILYSEERIDARVCELAKEIAQGCPQDMMIVALLRGSFVFAADLIRALHACGVRPQIDFLTASSYGAGKESSGEITVYRDVSEPVAGRDILLIDDILESGGTLHFARELMKARGARSVRIAVLLEKPGKRKVEIAADYVGFVVPDHFVVGYGLDYAHYYRELPYIGILRQ